ncbi:hypothetical protein HZS_291, partial [Henneguya salminicola]
MSDSEHEQNGGDQNEHKFNKESKIDESKLGDSEEATNIVDNNLTKILGVKIATKESIPQSIVIKKCDIETLIKHFEITKAEAENILKQNNGDVISAGKNMISLGYFAAALKKAREIAAKMQVNAKPVGSDEPEAKRSTADQTTFDSKRKLALQIANNLSRRIPKEIRVLSGGLNKDGELVIHMMIPTILVCLFAGQNNETLEWMIKSTCTKMEMDFDHPYANSNEKPLTITGEPDKVESAREVVNQYIKEKDELLGINANNMQVSLGIEYSELLIPKEAVGLVIGKQGENIKKVNNETGCIVKFRPPGPHEDDRYRICTFHGTTSQIKKAREQISDLVEYLKQKFGLARPIPKPGQEFAEVRVSAAKAGIVIGKGGETIKQINNLSGATVCIDRSVPDGSEYRTFFVVGNHQQVEHAKYLIREKSGETCELPLGAIMALNPMLAGEAFANQPPLPPMLPMVMPQYGFDPTGGLQSPWYNPPQPTFEYSQQIPVSSPETSHPNQQDSNQDYTAAWTSYYQQYYANYPQQTAEGAVENNNMNPQEIAAYYQSYYQQYYAQNPEMYQQYLASQNQPQNGAQAEYQQVNQTPYQPVIEQSNSEQFTPNYHTMQHQKIDTSSVSTHEPLPNMPLSPKPQDRTMDSTYQQQTTPSPKRSHSPIQPTDCQKLPKDNDKIHDENLHNAPIESYEEQETINSQEMIIQSPEESCESPVVKEKITPKKRGRK